MVIFDLVVMAILAVGSVAFFYFVLPGTRAYPYTNVWIGMAISFVFWFMCNLSLWVLEVAKAGEITSQPLSSDGYQWAAEIIVYILAFYFADRFARAQED